jgi:hypothetical protein
MSLSVMTSMAMLTRSSRLSKPPSLVVPVGKSSEVDRDTGPWDVTDGRLCSVVGNIWLMDIWDLREPHVRIPPLHGLCLDSSPRHMFLSQAMIPRGWGILVVKGDDFLPAEDYHDALGLDDGDFRYASDEAFGRWIDSSRSVKNVPNNSLWQPWKRVREESRGALQQHEEKLDREAWFGNAHGAQLTPPSTFYQAGTLRSKQYQGQGDCPLLKDGSSILRFYEADIELRSFERDGIGIMFQHATRQHRPRSIQTPMPPALHWLDDRLSIVLHVPELSLVVAGSMTGRIALITLTRPREDPLGLKRGLRVEAILPTMHQENEHLRPACPLLGVAVGPIPHDGVANSIGPRRYRLMIQYYDLRVLSYEIGRNVSTGTLTIGR